MVNMAVKDWGRIDILINNAAISDDTPMEDLSDTQWRHVLSINLDLALHVARAALPHLKQSRPAASSISPRCRAFAASRIPWPMRPRKVA